jgi:hypothetical protein
MALDFAGLSTPAPAASGGVRAPAWPLFGAAAAAVLSAALLFMASSIPATAAGYCLGCLAVPLFVVGFRFLKMKASTSPLYLPRAALDRAATGLVAVGLAVGVVNAWFLATELAKR